MTADTEIIAHILAVIEDEEWDPVTKLEIVHEIISDNFRPISF